MRPTTLLLLTLTLTACGDPAPEKGALCSDGHDNDGDALIDCDDDGCSASEACTDADGDRYTADEDCDDGDASTHPHAAEICDGVDNDCDELVDEGDAIDATLWYADDDGDGFGTPDATAVGCDQPNGYVDDTSDCDDDDATAYPGADELCDGVDNDCDDLVDDDDPDVTDTTTWYLDYDGDGHGGDDSAYELEACDQPSGYVADAGDCDDTDATMDCVDDDGDGFTELEGDCDDQDAADSPGAIEYHQDIAMTCIGPGTFTMGSPDGSGDVPEEIGRDQYENLREVTLTRGFYIGIYEVTQSEFESLMGYNPSLFAADDTGDDGEYDLFPVESLTWHEAVHFANAVSEAAGFPSEGWCYDDEAEEGFFDLRDDLASIYDCEAYRLLTEAEWEYAARAGTTSAFANGANLPHGWDPDMILEERCPDGGTLLDDGSYLDEIAWYECNSASASTRDVGWWANPWGLYDMHGNAGEWCHDFWDGTEYSEDGVVDPWIKNTGSMRIYRGGAYNYNASRARSAQRARADYSDTEADKGLRLARTAD